MANGRFQTDEKPICPLLFAICLLPFFPPLRFQRLVGLHRLQLVNQKFSIRGQGYEEMGQRPGAGPTIFAPPE